MNAIAWSRTLTVALLLGGLTTFAVAAGNPAPPTQPVSGPGGSTANHAAMTSQQLGTGAAAVWIFSPDSPRPASAPVAVFVHGWGGMDPTSYGAWIKHMVLRGYTVIFPIYQDGLSTSPADMLANAKTGVTAAWKFLNADPGAVRPATRMVAWVAHSEGGYIAPDLAAVSSTMGLPRPGALFLAAPANGSYTGIPASMQLPLTNLDQIPADTLVLGVVGDHDNIAGDLGARTILGLLPQVPHVNKELVTVHTDLHPDPNLVADHYACCAPDASIVPGTTPGSTGGTIVVDALDYYAYWKLSDGLLDAAFFGVNRQFALGDTPEQTFMGVCSDGRPVTKLTVESP